ncbi:MAG TPA: ATP12 family protein [Alphaproteobacteria bacterium]|nr:ATP12 chaperone family protein [Alphaproteobacteria bacterium]USO04839.1 MAG: ATP12 chaperone family protein [Rhodospirillales bacterium]HOO80905.1 ATP12 family protein [Alphaproteobacteria bacterium]
MKKFYKLVSVHQEVSGWAVHLDSRPVKTPLKKTLLASSETMATAIQEEWAAQGETIDPETMPLTQILSTQIDRVSEQRAAMSAELLKFLDTDLICYRAPKDQPAGQAEKQAESWDRWLTWFEDKFDCALQTTTDLAALKQPAAAHTAVQTKTDALDDARFTALQLVVPLSGSLVLGLAFIEGAITPQEIYNAARVEEHFKDEIYNAEKYGRDPLSEKKDAAMLRDLEAAAAFLNLL